MRRPEKPRPPYETNHEQPTKSQATKNRPSGRIFVAQRRLGSQGLDASAQAALGASALVLIDAALGGQMVYHRHGRHISGLGLVQVLGLDWLVHVLHVGTTQGTQAGFVAATLRSLAGDILGGRA